MSIRIARVQYPPHPRLFPAVCICDRARSGDAYKHTHTHARESFLYHNLEKTETTSVVRETH